MAYATHQEVHDYQNLGDDNVDDGVVTDLITRVQAAIDVHTGQVFEAASDSSRTFDAKADVDNRTLHFNDFIASITSVTNGDGTTVAASDYVTEPRNTTPYYAITLKASAGLSWLFDDNGNPEDAITVTGRWAYSTAVPNDVKLATILWVVHVYKRRDHAGIDIDRAQVADSGMIVLPAAMPRNVMELLKPYRNRI